MTLNIRCYDNGGKTADRFTVVYLGKPERARNTFAARGMDSTPFHPQGIGMSCTAVPGRHLGLRVNLKDLPADCQQLVRADLAGNS